MKCSVTASVAALALTASALPTANAKRATTPKVYLAGDSTMASGGGGSGTQGWGEYLSYSLNIEVVNDAIAGRSARSYYDEGRFSAMAEVVEAGDFVVIEFGHNDGGSLSSSDNGRTDCPGSGTETCTTTDGTVVYTFPFYVIQGSKAMAAKGAHVIVSSQTPNNVWETGSYEYSPSRFVGYAATAAKSITNGTYVDHGAYVADEYETLGETTVDAYYPNDHTHTSPEGADTVAKAFVKGIVCAENPLADYVKNATSSIQGECL